MADANMRSRTLDRLRSSTESQRMADHQARENAIAAMNRDMSTLDSRAASRTLHDRALEDQAGGRSEMVNEGSLMRDVQDEERAREREKADMEALADVDNLRGRSANLRQRLSNRGKQFRNSLANIIRGKRTRRRRRSRR